MSDQRAAPRRGPQQLSTCMMMAMTRTALPARTLDLLSCFRVWLRAKGKEMGSTRPHSLMQPHKVQYVFLGIVCCLRAVELRPSKHFMFNVQLYQCMHLAMTTSWIMACFCSCDSYCIMWRIRVAECLSLVLKKYMCGHLSTHMRCRVKSYATLEILCLCHYDYVRQYK